jgi:hypothetical protein
MEQRELERIRRESGQGIDPRRIDWFGEEAIDE